MPFWEGVMVRVENAVNLIKSNTEAVEGFEELFIGEVADRIAYEDVLSENDIPGFLRSAMDGYGLVGRCSKYRLVEREDELADCACIRINTGFPIPDKVYAVAEVEIVETENGFIKLTENVQDGRNFTVPGVEVKKGDVILKAGERVSLRKRALLAYCGISVIKVRRKPIVGLITTGDEVIFPSRRQGEHTVFNANYFILDGLVKKWFGEPVYFGHVGDSVKQISELIFYALDRCDLVITSGGVSMGSRDFVKEVVKEGAFEVIFDKTTIKPGKPAVFAKKGNKLFFGMPGWPSALYATAYLYLKPMMLKLAGYREKELNFKARLLEPMKSKKGKFYFNRVKIGFDDDGFTAISAGSQKTDNFYSTAAADGLLGIDEKRGSVEKGQRLPLILFDD